MSNSVPQDLFFRDIVESYTTASRFVHRDWLARDVETQISGSAARFILVTAEPGAGKSALVAQLAADHTDWPVFFIRRDQRTSLGEFGARSFLLRIGLQLAAIHPELFTLDQVRIDVEQRVGSAQGDIIGAEIERIRASPFHSTVIHIRQEIDKAGGSVQGVKIGEWITDPRLLAIEDLQQMALFDPARALQRLDPKQRIIILVDALDELQYHEEERNLLEWLSNCPPLPDNVRIVLTSRPTHGPLGLFIERRAGSVALLPIAAADPRVQADLRTYAVKLLDPPEISAALAEIGRDRESLLNELVEKADGNIGYLAALGRAFDQARAAVEHRSLLIELLSLRRLPDDIQGLYGFFLHLIQNGPGKKDIRVTDPADGKVRLTEAWPEVYQPILALLVVTFEPVSLDQIHALAGTFAGRPQVAQALEWLDQFLDHVGSARRLYHATLAEFLTSATTKANDSTSDLFVDVEEEHARLAGLVDGAAVWENSDDAREACRRDYFKRHYVEHLFSAKAWGKLYATLDEGLYGRGKLRFDSSTLLYSRDMELAIRAVSRPEADDLVRLRRLPRLWRYQLLRVTLSNFADDLPASGYMAMALVGRSTEASDLANLITDVERQSLVMVQLAAEFWRQQITPDRAQELLRRGFEAAERAHSDNDRAAHLSQLLQAAGMLLAEVPLAFQAAVRLARGLPMAAARARTLSALSSFVAPEGQKPALNEEFLRIVQAGADGEENDALFFTCATCAGDAQDWQTAHDAVSHIHYAGLKIEALMHIAAQEHAAGNVNVAEASQNEAATLIDGFPAGLRRAHAGVLLAQGHLALGQTDRAAPVLAAAWDQLELPDTSSSDPTKVLAEIARALQRVGDGPRLEAAASRLYALAMKDLQERTLTPGHGYSLSFLAINAARALAAVDQCDRALILVEKMQAHEREDAFIAVVDSFVRQSQWDRALATAEQMKLNSRGVHFHVSITSEDEVTDSSNYNANDRASLMIARGLGAGAMWERALATANTIDNVEPRLDALSQIAAFMHESDQVKMAVALVKKIELEARLSKFSGKREQALVDGLGLLIRGRSWDQARTIANSIADARLKAAGQEAIAHALIRTGDVAATQGFLREIADAAVCARVALELAQVAAKAADGSACVIRHLIDARDDARREPEMVERAKLLRSIALAFGELNTGALQEAMDTMNEVMLALKAAPPFGWRPSPWCATIAAYASLGNWERALQIGDDLLAFEAFDGCSALCELSAVARGIGNSVRARILVDKARDHVAGISFEPMQAGMRATIAEEYARQGNMDEALKSSLVTPDAKNDALIRIAKVLAESGDVAAGKTLLLDLPEDASADSAKVAMVTSLLRANHPDQARLTAATIVEPDARAAQILAIGAHYLASGMREEGFAALTEVNELSRSFFSDTAAGTIRDIAAGLIGAADPTKAIALVEERWLGAATHADLLPLMRIAEPLVDLQPDIALGFYRSFDWIGEMMEAN